MKLIFGLGNVGKEYEKTRHNVGFLAVDEFAKKYEFGDFKLESKFKAMISEKIVNREKIVLAKPITYMNLSGESLVLLKSFYKLEVDDIVVVYDDKDMEFGKIRVRSSGSSGGHNGIKSIIKVLGETFKRIKIGIGDKDHPAFSYASDFVLGRFSEKEFEDLNIDILSEVVAVIARNSALEE